MSETARDTCLLPVPQDGKITGGMQSVDLPSTPMTTRDGILLLGPTGAGKSPLGDHIEARGLWGRSFRHFDFGENLRRVVAQETPGRQFSQADLQFLRDVLESGALLENEQFVLAERILRQFLALGAGEIVLNGLPRHRGQAEAVSRIVHIHTVVCLECSDDVVLQRISSNVGGDRTDRADDQRHEVRNKLALFARRTQPLIQYYSAAGCRVVSLPVLSDTTPDGAWRQLQACRPD